MGNIIEKAPAYVAKAQNAIQDNFGADDVAVPQIRLLQGLSPQVVEFDNARAGEFWHTGMDIPLGEEVSFIVASRRRRYLLQAPLEDGQGVLARADDGVTWDRTGEWDVQIDKKTRVKWKIEDRRVDKSGLTAWGTSDPEDPESPPAATLFYDYLVLLPDHMDFGPSVISLARTAIRKAKRGLNDKIMLHRNNGRPMQCLVFQARPGLETVPSGDFYNWGFRQQGFAEEADYAAAVKLGEEMAMYRVEDPQPVGEEF